MDIDQSPQDTDPEAQFSSIAIPSSLINPRFSHINTPTREGKPSPPPRPSGVASLDTTVPSYNQAAAATHAGGFLRPGPLSVRFAAENEQLRLSPANAASSPTPTAVTSTLLSHGSLSSTISSSSINPSLYNSTTTTYNSSTGSCSSPPLHLSSVTSISPELVSPPSSAFVSASASPISTPFPAVVEFPPAIELEQALQHIQSPSKSALPQPPPPPLSNLQQSIAVPGRTTLSTSIDDSFVELRFVKPTSDTYNLRHQLNAGASVEQAASPPRESEFLAQLAAITVRQLDRAPPTPIINTSPSASFRPRTCDVYIGVHGCTSSLSRFSKWLRAELEFQGIACFLADRARYTDPRIHDIARRIMQSCTFGVVVINKKTFKNLYSIEELQIFQERKNLVPLFFDLAPSDCMARDIVERRGEVWEREGGELWRAFGGKEREWREAVDGLSRIEEWKLEAFNGNWRDCILRAVSLLGTRIGRRSVAERERARKQRVEREEFPFPRNTNFVGREKELRAVEKLLFGNADEESHQLEQQQDAPTNLDHKPIITRSKHSFKTHVPNRKQITYSQSERWSRRAVGDVGTSQQIADNFENRRRSDADMWHSRYMQGALESGDSGRRKSDSDRWQSFVTGGGLESGLLRRNDFETWFASKEGGNTSLVLSDTAQWSAAEDHRQASMKKKAISKDLEIQEAVDDRLASKALIQGTRTKSRVFRDGKQRSSASSNSRRKKVQGSRSKSESALGSSSMQEEEGEGSASAMGISACICGGAGMGKTELALELTYRFSQRYRMVLWIGGETRYLRQNYLNLSVLLGLDVGTESQVGPERGRIRTFEEQEREALQRVRRELERDVPYLLVIDNLESERDWWDRKEVVELLPRPGNGGATHVIVTTRLPKVASMPNAVKLLYLSGVEAISLMRGKRELSAQELDALKEMEEKLDRSTFGLGLVGKILAELPSMMPSVLLEKVNKGFPDSWASVPREDTTLKSNSFLSKLLGVCFSFLDQLGGPRKLASRMACIGGWCAPFPIPISLLGAAAIDLPEQSSSLVARVFRDSVLFCGTTQTRRAESEAGTLLVRLGIARKCTRQGWIFFDEILQLYARKRGGVFAARAMVQGIKKRGVILQHSEHFWAACFLVFGFANDPVVVDLRAVELLSFIKKGALQLAFRAFTTFSRCRAALELLRLCTNMLEDVEKSFVSQTQDWWGRSLCWRPSSSTHNYMVHQAASVAGAGNEVDEYVWEEATLLKALLLETRAKLLLKGGQFDAGEEICRTSISIRTVMLGEHHPDTISAQETLAKLVRSRSNT